MNFSRLLVLALGLLVVAGCGNYGRGGPDGGDNRILCTDGITSLNVTVNDAQGNPVKGATVSAKHLGTNTTVTSTTNDQGLATAVTSDQGSGSIQLRATEGTRTSNLQQVEWICGECTCTASPSSIVLTLQ